MIEASAGRTHCELIICFTVMSAVCVLKWPGTCPRAEGQLMSFLGKSLAFVWCFANLLAAATVGGASACGVGGLHHSPGDRKQESGTNLVCTMCHRPPEGPIIIGGPWQPGASDAPYALRRRQEGERDFQGACVRGCGVPRAA